MFLTYGDHARVRIVRSILWLAMVVISVHAEAADSRPACVLEVPVYDAHGNRVSSVVKSVRLEGSGGANLLTIEDKAYRVVVDGPRLYFPDVLIGRRRLELTIETAAGLKAKRLVPLMSCRQRTSLELGRLDTVGDVSSTTVRGRLVGCNLGGDWWIRAMPMFGALESVTIHEGFVRPDGVFKMTSSFTGERYVFVVGNGKRVIKALAADVVVGETNDIGEVDLRGLCPE
jgi:hypothetical protein